MASNYEYRPWDVSPEKTNQGILQNMLYNVKFNKSRVTLYTVNGFQMKGIVLDYDEKCIVFKNEKNGKANFVMFTAISTVEPV